MPIDPRILAAMPENEFQKHVVKVAEDNNWLVWHDNHSRWNAAGLPDLLLVRDDVLVFAEIKTQVGRLRPAQETWIAALGAVEHTLVDVWRPGKVKKIEELLVLGGRSWRKEER